MMNTATLNVRLVPRGFAAVSDPRAIPARAVPFVWSEHERAWRSVEPLFVTAAKREGDGAYRAVSELADGPFYHTALRIPGTANDNAATLQARLDGELLQLVAPQRWACADCQRGFKKEKGAGPCARHQKEMPPAVLYKTTHPRVNRLGHYYVFGWARDFESTTPIADHNDDTWSPTVEAAATEHEALREASRLAAEQRAQAQAALDALSPAEKQADFERALFGQAGRWAAEVHIDGANQRREYKSREEAEQALIAIAREALGRSFADYTEAREALLDSDRVAWADVSTIESDVTCPKCGNLGGWDQERGECAPCGHVTASSQTENSAPAPVFTPEQQAAIEACFKHDEGALGCYHDGWLGSPDCEDTDKLILAAVSLNASNGIRQFVNAEDAVREGSSLLATGYCYGSNRQCRHVIDPERVSPDQALTEIKAVLLASRYTLERMIGSEIDTAVVLFRAFGREQDARELIETHANGDCFWLNDDETAVIGVDNEEHLPAAIRKFMTGGVDYDGGVNELDKDRVKEMLRAKYPELTAQYS